MLDNVRKRFINFFAANGHKGLSSASLIPHNDSSLMFVNAGMVPFKEYFMDTRKAPYTNIVTSQKCVRAGGKHNDLENVGHTKRHHTFFEMLGNFSFGGYFKEGAIKLAWEFITKELKLEKNRLYITIYHTDDEAFEIWSTLTGFGEDRIIRISTDDNFWQMGDTGPCGPCSEIFYDHGSHLDGDLPGDTGDTGERYVEIWNLVFMQYVKGQDGNLTRIEQPCIDTGMGLERIAAVLEGTDDNYEIALFRELIQESQRITRNKNNVTAHRVISDHIRSASFLIADGVLPGNTGKGYVLRRITRRAVRYSNMLGFEKPLLPELFHTLEKLMGQHYPELTRARDLILETLETEEISFRSTLKAGMKMLDEISNSLKEGDVLPGDVAFTLYDTHGFPLDLTIDILKERKISVNESEFMEKMQGQRALARASWTGNRIDSSNNEIKAILLAHGKTEFIGYESFSGSAVVLSVISSESVQLSKKLTLVLDRTTFYPESGGQESDHGIIFAKSATLRVERVYKSADGIILHDCCIVDGHTVRRDEQVSLQIDLDRRNKLARNHSATHILHHVLRKKLGMHVMQKGSLVAADRFRFDFTHNHSLTEEEISDIEDGINLMLWNNHTVSIDIKNIDDAIKSGAIALFGEKYDDTVRVVSIGGSVELCGGTHVGSSASIGLVKILSESSIARGTRRIEAVTHLAALEYLREKERNHLNKLDELELRLRALQKQHQREVTHIYHCLMENVETKVEQHGSLKVVIKKIHSVPKEVLVGLAPSMRSMADILIMHTNVANGVYLLIILGSDLMGNRKLISSIRKLIEESYGNIFPSAPYIIQAILPSIANLEMCLTKLSGYISSVG
ncbi:alanine--tRNA ligase [Neorickettsia helminthoeca str. Oregon]|uniref:Alanine--tRNA ligase n=1 Tax=Neorickettsia helminthoeca str. Oregon TaxID=1286528 RepID=X5HL72_9RICK|nr:alanine--tRNA ligase [Neorickettsia helminthoeca]AHX11110.1 alanine--tRNA ligase [Neorickettsia helminthoeca str. Oregon]